MHPTDLVSFTRTNMYINKNSTAIIIHMWNKVFELRCSYSFSLSMNSICVALNISEKKKE